MSKSIGLAMLLLAGGCASTALTTNRPKEVILKDTYDPSAVRDAVAHVIFRARLDPIAEDERSITAAGEPCSYTIAYAERRFEVRAAPIVPRADGRIEERCLDTTAKLAKRIVKEVERPALLAKKAEKAQRRAERTAAVFGALGAVAQVAGTAASVAAPAMRPSGPSGSSGGTRTYASSTAQRQSSVQSSQRVTVNGQPPVADQRVFSADGRAFNCPRFGAERCMVSNECSACVFDPAGGRPVTITRAR